MSRFGWRQVVRRGILARPALPEFLDGYLDREWRDFAPGDHRAP